MIRTQVQYYAVEFDLIAKIAAKLSEHFKKKAQPRKPTSCPNIPRAYDIMAKRLEALQARPNIQKRPKLGDIIELELTLPEQPLGWLWFDRDLAGAIAAQALSISFKRNCSRVDKLLESVSEEICRNLFKAIEYPEVRNLVNETESAKKTA